MKNTKKTYQTPALKNWGKVADLTQVGLTTVGQDTRGGSVYPPGGPKGPVL